MSKLILASSSQRRYEILTKTGVEFEIYNADIDESFSPYEDPVHLSKRLALGKAKKVYDLTEGKISVIGADTVVALDEILGKPRDDSDAYRILKKLSGKEHLVITGVAFIDADKDAVESFHEVTYVDFKELTDEEIFNYIATKEPNDKAGAYGIQGKGGIFVKSIRGCFYNVMGFPLYRIYTVLKDHNFI